MRKPPKATKEKKADQIGIRITDDERKRLNTLLALLKNSYGFLTPTILWRELMSLSDSNIITADHRSYLSGKSSILRIDMVAELDENGAELTALHTKKG